MNMLTNLLSAPFGMVANGIGAAHRGAMNMTTDGLQAGSNDQRVSGQFQTNALLENGHNELVAAEDALTQAAVLRVLQDEIRTAMADSAAGSSKMQQIGVQ
jgi:hypothetical protein